MRKFLISAALVTATIAAAAPASAQWARRPQGNAYGYNNNYGQVRRLEARVDQIRRQIEQLDRRNICPSARHAASPRKRAISTAGSTCWRATASTTVTATKSSVGSPASSSVSQRDVNDGRNNRYGNGYRMAARPRPRRPRRPLRRRSRPLSRLSRIAGSMKRLGRGGSGDGVAPFV